MWHRVGPATRFTALALNSWPSYCVVMSALQVRGYDPIFVHTNPAMGHNEGLIAKGSRVTPCK